MKSHERNLVMEKVDCNFLPQLIFPTLVGIYNFGLSNHELNCNLVRDSLIEKQSNSSGVRRSNIKGWHSEFGLEQKYESFKKLQSLIQSSSRHYCEYYGYDSNIYCNQLWVNLNEKTSSNRIHHHGSSYLTGVYYPAKSIVNNEPTFNYTSFDKSLLKNGFDCPHENNSPGSLYFLSPSHSESRTLSVSKSNEYNAEARHIYPTSSILLIFPSHLLHGVNPFDEDCTRISISFDIGLNYD